MTYDIICFSHLRWNFVYQRPQHLMKRFARHERVFIFEEPVFGSENNYLEVNQVSDLNVWVATPHVQHNLEGAKVVEIQATLVNDLIISYEIMNIVAWYYSPMALAYSDHLNPALIVYDCMDELSAFNNPPPALTAMEKKLFDNADIVFTGGHNLFKAKKSKHSNIFSVPSSIDKEHFLTARKTQEEPADQQMIPHVRIGFYGVVDERFNTTLLSEIAGLQPAWQFVIIGPVVKIDAASLPINSNIHYLGGKSYDELPAYLSGWDVAMMPFALNRSTQFISPTKTPEYLAGGKPVVSTSITDVVTPYGDKGLVFIADTAPEFVAAIQKALTIQHDKEWMEEVDAFLDNISWDKTWSFMKNQLNRTLENKKINNLKTPKVYV